MTAPRDTSGQTGQPGCNHHIGGAWWPCRRVPQTSLDGRGRASECVRPHFQKGGNAWAI